MVYSLSTITANYRHERRIPCRKIVPLLSMLARNLICHECAKIFKFVNKIISSEDFIVRNRLSNTAFTRKRKLPLNTLIIFLVNFVRGSYQDELDKFFKTIFCLDVAKRVVSKAALTKARAKLKFDAFIELNAHLVSYFETIFRLVPGSGLDCWLSMAQLLDCRFTRILSSILAHGRGDKVLRHPWPGSRSYSTY